MATGYHLLDHPNPNSKVRGDGRRGWFYSTRRAEIQIISVHTAENAIDLLGEDAGAERIADYLDSSTRPASYHEVGDSDSFVQLLPDTYTAFSVVGYNAEQWSYAFALRTIDWKKDRIREERFLRIGAERVALACLRFGIPVRELTKAQVDRGMRGIVRHSVMDPSRRSDPGHQFEMTHFLQLVREFMDKIGRVDVMAYQGELVAVDWAGDGKHRLYKVAGNTRAWVRTPDQVQWLRDNEMVPEATRHLDRKMLEDLFPIVAAGLSDQ